MASLIPQPRLRFYDEDGLPLEGGFVWTYIAGTTTLLNTFTNQSGITANPNPVPLESDGGANIWFKGAYKVDVKKANGNSLQGYPVDNINIYDLLDWSQLTASVADLNATNTSTLSKTADYTVVLSNRGKTILCDATALGFTIALLAAASAGNGYEITIKKTDVSTNIVTIDGNGSETIEGRATFLLYDQNDVVTLICDGSNWRVKSGVIRGNTELKSTAFTTTISDINKTFICSAVADYAVTLLSAVTAGDGFRQTFKKSADAFFVTLTAAGMETIDGDATFLLNLAYQSVSLISNGTNWLIIAENNVGDADTGDVEISFRPTPKAGFVAMNDGTIGSATSGATTRANADTRSLFILLWDNVIDMWAPVSTGRGASGAADFTANKTLRLPKALGRALAISGMGSLAQTFTTNIGSFADQLILTDNSSFYTGTPVTLTTAGTLPAPLAIATTYYVINGGGSTNIYLATTLANAIANVPITLTTNAVGTNTVTINYSTRALGQITGEESQALVVAQIPAHTHQSDFPTNQVMKGTDDTGNVGAATPHTTSSTGGSQAHNNMQPTLFLKAYIKL